MTRRAIWENVARLVEENVERFFKYTRAKRLGLTKFFLIQIFSLQYFHLKLFLCDRQRLNIDGTGRRFCLKFSWEPQNTISSDGTNFPKNFFRTKPFITPVFLGLMPSSLVLFKGQTVVYKLFSKRIGYLIRRLCDSSR